MTTLKAIIGANYGDEGKGRMTDYFASQSLKQTIVVCSNGGAQRGHTVYDQKGRRHIFRHFGSGTFAGADTYLPKQFIVNPMLFMEELNQLRDYPTTKIYVNPDCLCSTPFDMIVNQIVEEERGINKHGSCGVGIWETILRNEATVGELMVMSNEELRKYLTGVRDTYFLNRLKEKNIEVPARWRDIFFSSKLIDNYIYDFKNMLNHVILNTDICLKFYDTVIFENGQGLLLDQNVKDSKHSTPSNTGSRNIQQIVDSLYEPSCEYVLEVCYVTRSYLTRHGAGELEGECNPTEFNIKHELESNVWNKNQGIFRYGKLDIRDVFDRAKEDFKIWYGYPTQMSFAITHVDEYCPNFSMEDILGPKSFIRTYWSYGVERENIKVHDFESI